MDEPKDEFTHRPDLVRQRARVIMLERLWRTFIVVVLVGTLVIVILTTVQGAQTRERIADCTTPGGQCYEEGTTRTGEAVKGIIEQTLENGQDLHSLTRHIVVLAAWCADRPGSQDLDHIRQCINEQMKREQAD